LPAYGTRSLYPVKMAEAAWEAFKEQDPDLRPWVYSRSGYTGLQRYARTWSGDNVSDWKTLRYNQYMGFSLGLSGLPYYGHDLGGFFGEFPAQDLLVRSCQSAVFQGRFVIHSWREDGRPTEPWSYPAALDLIRGYVEEHYRFMPYIYNCAVAAARTGVPLERPLFLEFPQDPLLADDDTNSLFGPSILKVPVVDADTSSVGVRFPQGQAWYDPLAQRLYPGGTTAEVAVPLPGARWFARTPSIIPTSPDLKKLDTGFFGLVEFLIFPPAGDGSYDYTYYEDDGRTEPSLGRYGEWSLSVVYDAASRRGWVSLAPGHRGAGDPPGRVFRCVLPPAFRFTAAGGAQATVNALRQPGGVRWEFEGAYP